MVTIQTQQILVPKQVYIADRAELRCNFTTDAEIVRDALIRENEINLSKNAFCSDLNYSDYDISDIKVLNTGANTYTLVITFVPWHTGNITFPDFDIGLALNGESNQYILKIDSIKINSIVEENSISGISEISSPLLLPGTTYKLYGGIIGIIILLIVIVRLIVKHKAVEFFFKTKILQHKYLKNKKNTIKKLQSVEENDDDTDRNTAATIQKIVREYFEIRFDYPFTRTVTSELMNGFYERTKHLITGEKEDAFIGIASTFIRTDFIRYSENASFKNGEKSELINKIIRNIEVIEQQEKKEVDKENA